MEQQSQDIFGLQVNHQGFNYLSEAAKWAKFIAILGFIFCGFMVLGALFAGAMISTAMSDAFGGGSAIGGGAFTIIYLALAALYFFPCLYLFRFASKVQVSIRNNDQEVLTNSLQNLKSYFKFLGILFIIIISLYILVIIGAIIAGAAGVMN